MEPPSIKILLDEIFELLYNFCNDIALCDFDDTLNNRASLAIIRNRLKNIEKEYKRLYEISIKNKDNNID